MRADELDATNKSKYFINMMRAREREWYRNCNYTVSTLSSHSCITAVDFHLQHSKYGKQQQKKSLTIVLPLTVCVCVCALLFLEHILACCTMQATLIVWRSRLEYVHECMCTLCTEKLVDSRNGRLKLCIINERWKVRKGSRTYIYITNSFWHLCKCMSK